MKVEHGRTRDSELNPDLKELRYYNKSDDTIYKTDSQKLLRKLEIFFSSQDLQSFMLVLVFLYIALAMISLSLSLIFKHSHHGRQSNHSTENAILGLAIVEAIIMFAFPIELLLRSIFTKPGFYAYFGEFWNSVEFIFLLFSALLDVIELIFSHLVDQVAIIILSFRIISSIRTLYFYKHIGINKEILKIDHLKDIITELENEINIKYHDNNIIQEQIRMQEIAAKMLPQINGSSRGSFYTAYDNLSQLSEDSEKTYQQIRRSRSLSLKYFVLEKSYA